VAAQCRAAAEHGIFRFHGRAAGDLDHRFRAGIADLEILECDAGARARGEQAGLAVELPCREVEPATAADINGDAFERAAVLDAHHGVAAGIAQDEVVAVLPGGTRPADQHGSRSPPRLEIAEIGAAVEGVGLDLAGQEPAAAGDLHGDAFDFPELDAADRAQFAAGAVDDDVRRRGLLAEDADDLRLDLAAVA